MYFKLAFNTYVHYTSPGLIFSNTNFPIQFAASCFPQSLEIKQHPVQTLYLPNTS